MPLAIFCDCTARLVFDPVRNSKDRVFSDAALNTIERIHIVIFCYFALKHKVWDLSIIISKNRLIRALPTGTHKNL